MNIALSQALDITRRWERDHVEVHGTMGIAAQEFVIDFDGWITVEGDSGLAVRRANACDVRIALAPTMTFTYGDKMMRITGTGWECNLYEDRNKPFVGLA